MILLLLLLLFIMKSSFNRDNNFCHYVIQRIAGFAITLYYHPAGLDVIMVVYHLRSLWLVNFLFGLGRWFWLVGRGESSNRRVHSMISGGFVIISTAKSQFSRWSPVIWSPTTICGFACSFHSFRKSSLAELRSPAIVCLLIMSLLSWVE
jgi:hypothetical protein